MRLKLKGKVDRRAFDKKIDNVKNLTKNALHAIGQHQVMQTQRRISTEKADPDGTKWRPLALSTLKARDGKGRGALWATGQLFSSIKYKVVNKTVQVFTSLPYARWLQFGSRNAPARPFIGFGKADVNTIHKIIRDELND